MARADKQPLRLGPRAERWFDVTLTCFLLLPVPVFLFAGSSLDGVLMLLQITPLFWRRHHAAPVFAVVASASALQALLVDEPLWSQVAFPIATYSVARYAATAWGIAAVAIGLAGAVVASLVWLHGFDAVELTPTNVSAYFIPVALFVIVAWALGTLGRTRQAYVDALVERGARLERDAAQQAALAAMEERHRIAREMHDVVAHGLTTIVVQADGARAAAAHDPDVSGPALQAIASAGREAITEMRGMLGVLRAEELPHAPQPRLAALSVLIDEVRSAGTPVIADIVGLSDLPPVSDGVALTAYRIVQEGLSNVRKHAGPGATATVSVRPGDPGDPVPQALVISVIDDGRGAAAPDDGHGLGLTGMQERAAAHGGTLASGPNPGGGYRVGARIPL